MPKQLRPIGDSLVKTEFRQHFAGDEKYMVPFLQEWIKYYETMVETTDHKDLGRDLTELEQKFLTPEQVSSLNSIKDVSKDEMIQNKIGQAMTETGGVDPLTKG